MSRILFAATYPFTPGQVDAIVLVSRDTLSLGEKVVLLPPFPSVDVIGLENEFFRLMTVEESELPDGVEAIEISPESFLALGTANPNKVDVPSGEEVAQAMTKQDSLERDWSKDMLGEGRESEDESD